MSSAESTVRLAHFSDIHLTAKRLGWRPRDLLTKRTTGWLHLKLHRGKRFRDAESVLGAMLADIRERSVDHLVFSGDATTLGYGSEVEVAARLLGVGEAGGLSPRGGLAVPGNHDAYVRRAARSGDFERAFAAWQQGERIGDEIYPFAQRVGHCWLIGVNSSRSNFLVWDARGQVDHGQAQRLRELANALSPGPRILVTHYPLYLSDGSPEDRWRQLRDWPAFRKLVLEIGISLWLHGHRHRGYLLTPNDDHPFPIICSGSATQAGLASWNEYTITGSSLTMIRRRLNPTETRFEDSDRFELPLPRPN